MLMEVKVQGQVAEAVANFMMELGSPGLEVKEEGDQRILRGYLRGEIESPEAKIRLFLDSLRSLGLGVGPGEVLLSSQPTIDWLAEWRKGFHPFPVGRKLLIRPSWEAAPAAPGRLIIVIDPQMAFGTGEHYTTRFCLQALEEHLQGEDSVLDVGTGSGILSIAAVKLGASRAVGLDIDPQAVQTARENARVNGVSERVEIRGDPIEHLEARNFDLVLANIDGHTLLALLPELKRVARIGGKIVLAGFLIGDEKALLRGLSDHDLGIYRMDRQEEWICAVATNGEA
jgi:ribosomal protein L11 methyltransferase